MTEFWLISAPGDETCQQTWEKLNNVTAKQNKLSTNYKFHIPDLKVGYLDQLVLLTDELGRLDSYVEGVARKIAQYFSEVLEDHRDKLMENLLANGVDLSAYLTKFQWDAAKYPVKQSLKNLADILNKSVTQIDTDLKNKAAAYNSVKNSLQTMDKKQTGALLTRNLWDIVKKEHFVLNSEYLTTLLVVVQKSMFTDWKMKYERLNQYVVPRSTELLYQDQDSGLFTVTLFHKVVDEFKRTCRENRFVVRDFVYSKEALLAGTDERNKLMTDKKKQFGPLVRWLKVNFSQCFTAWIHVKALRVFVESVLRYGLPVKFQAMLLQPNKKCDRRLRDVLNQLYGHLDAMSIQGTLSEFYKAPHKGFYVAVRVRASSSDELLGKIGRGYQRYLPVVDIPGLGFGQGEYYPYVYYKLDIDMLDTRMHS